MAEQVLGLDKFNPQVAARILGAETGASVLLVFGDKLEQALANVKQLRGLLPMCAYCKKIRVDDKYWQQLEGYLSDHTEAEFSHGICPNCYQSIMKPQLEGADADKR